MSLTVDKSTLKNHRSLYEHRVLVRLAELLPPDVKVCVVADRGFGDQKLYQALTQELYFDYVIRFRGNIAVTATTGETRTAAAWVPPNGRARVLRDAAVTAERYPVATVICVQDTAMKQGWCLAASSTDATARQLTGYYGRAIATMCRVLAAALVPDAGRSTQCGVRVHRELLHPRDRVSLAARLRVVVRAGGVDPDPHQPTAVLAAVKDAGAPLRGHH